MPSMTGSFTQVFCFFFNDTATTEIYTLSLHDALPISHRKACPNPLDAGRRFFDALFYGRSEEHTSELQSLTNLVCRLLLAKKDTRGRAASRSLRPSGLTRNSSPSHHTVPSSSSARSITDNSDTSPLYVLLIFFFNNTAPTEIYSLSQHDALRI